MTGRARDRRRDRWSPVAAISIPKERRRFRRPGRPLPPAMFRRVTELPAGGSMHGWHGGMRGGDPVVIVHGLGAASDAERPIAAELADRFSVHVPDLPGFGLSPTDGVGASPAALADALAGWLEACDIPRAAFLGNSAGCQVILHLAAKHPHRVSRLVLHGPTPDRWARRTSQQALRLVVDGLFEHPQLLAVQLRGVRQAGLRRLRDSVRAALADRSEDTVTRVGHPVLVVRGGRDPVVSDRFARLIAVRARRGRHVTLPGGSHAMVFSYPRQLARAITPFLAGEVALIPSASQMTADEQLHARSDRHRPRRPPDHRRA